MNPMLKFLTTRKMSILDEGTGDGGSGDGAGAGAGDGGTGDGGAGSGDGGGAGTGDGSPPAKFNDWRDSIDVNLASEPTMQKFKNVDALAKSYLELQKRQNQHQVAIPKEGATPEDWRKVYERLGLPKELDKYDVGQIENMKPEQLAQIKKAAFDAGILPHQAMSFIKAQGEMAFNAETAKKNETEQYQQQQKQILQQDWGVNFNQNMEQVRGAIKYFGGEDALKTILQTPLANNAHVIKMFKAVADTLKEDQITGDFDSINTKESTLARIDAITNDPEYWDSRSPNYGKLVNEHELLMKKLYPN